MMVYRPFKAPYQRRKLFVPGKDRTSGFYGRFGDKGGELKFLDGSISQTPVAITGNIMNTGTLNVIAQGTGESERIGRKVTLTNIAIRYRWRLPEQDAVADPAQGDTIRLIMYLDKQANGATAAVTDILETAHWQSFNNLANSNRFVILMDKEHTLDYNSLASDGAGVISSSNARQNYTFYKKCNVPLEFSGTNGTIAEIRSNNIGMLLVSETAIGNLNAKYRLRYSDA